MKKLKLRGDIDYISGHLRYGHFEAEITKAQFDLMTKEQLKEFLEDNGELIVDDYEIDDCGEITEIKLVG